MLLYKGSRDNFFIPLQSVCGIVEKRHTLPILSNVLLESKNGKLTMLATDIEIQIKTSTETQNTDDVSLTVDARKVQDILRSLPENAEINLTLDDRKLQVKAGKSRFNLQTLPAEDFPTMKEAEGEQAKFSLPQKQLKNLLAMVKYSMAQQDVRYYLNGLSLHLDGSQIRLVATDGHRLAYITGSVNGATSNTDVIIPRKTVLELFKQLSDTDNAVEITINQLQAKFHFGNIEIVSKLIDGKFPDHDRVIPKNHDKLIVLSRDVLLHSLSRAAILINEKFRGVRIVLESGNLKIISSNAEQEEALEEIEVEYAGDSLDTGFNINYLMDILNNISNEKIECHLLDANSSAMFTLPGNKDFKYVVMPMRI